MNGGADRNRDYLFFVLNEIEYSAVDSSVVMTNRKQRYFILRGNIQ